MAYDFYLAGYQLPVPPQKLQLKIKNQNKTMSLINDGEINILKAPGLTEISFEAELPRARYPYASYPDGFHGAEYYQGVLELLKAQAKPFQFIVTRASPSGNTLTSTNIRVSLEDYQVTEEAGYGSDPKVSVTLKQYRDYATKALKVVAQGQAAVENERNADTAPSGQTYTVKSGDCLWKIAKKYYNNGSDYTKIFDANKDKVTNPNLIYPGQVLSLP